MTNQASPASSGAWTGALLGAVSRPVVVSAFWLLDIRSVVPWIEVLITSCIIGLLLGWIAGRIAASIRNPVIGTLWGAIVGACLGFVSSIFTLYFLCMATYVPAAKTSRYWGPDVNVGLYLATMALAGAIPGIVGGLVGDRVRQKQAAPSPAVDNGVDLDGLYRFVKGGGAPGPAADHGKTDQPGDGPSDPLA
jgi:hypothetical protein